VAGAWYDGRGDMLEADRSRQHQHAE